MFGPEMVGAFREFKSIWDPRGRMNPGKVVDPLPWTRTCDPPWRSPTPGRSSASPTTAARWLGPWRGASAWASAAANRAGHVPDFQATREERHSTRGRARLLWEMLEGEALPDLWRSDAFSRP